METTSQDGFYKDEMFSNLKLELITEKAKVKELTRNLEDVIRISGLDQGPRTIKDRRPEEQIKIIQSVSLEMNKRALNMVELNICIGMIGGNLLDKLHKITKENKDSINLNREFVDF